MTAARSQASPRLQVPSNSPLDRLCVVLSSTRNPLNIGAAARAMVNFGFSRLRVVNPFEASFREAKSAVGASTVLKSAQVFNSLADAVADCTLVVGTTAARDRTIDHPLRTLRAASSRIHRKLRSGQVALLFGSEKRGLSNSDFSYCDWLLRIPTLPDQPSMNLGQAVAVCLYEISGGSKPGVSTEPRPSASAADLHRLAVSLLDALRASGYPAKQDEEGIRRFVHRLKLSDSDAHLMLGMLRQMLWKMNNHS